MEGHAEKIFMSKLANGLSERVKDLVELTQSSEKECEEEMRRRLIPPEFTEDLKRKIKKLPLSEDIWYVHVRNEVLDEGDMLYASVHMVEKEHGSNGRPLGESDGLSFTLSYVAIPPDGERKSKAEQEKLILGGIVKACLKPAEQIMLLDLEICKQILKPRRPAKVLLQSKGALGLLRPHFKVLGIKGKLADPEIVTSVAASHIQGLDRTGFPEELEILVSENHDNLNNMVCESMMRNMSMGPYVSEDRLPLNDWIPPDDVNFPIEWYARPPQSLSYRPTQLLGWRTNLERAVMAGDIDKIIEITKIRDRNDVREFCECRTLLTKVAGLGNLISCRALLDHTDVSADGVQAADTRRHWRAMQEDSGNNYSRTPLHVAAFKGHCEVLKLLLDRGASIMALCQLTQGPALYFAVANGHSDCVALLCDRGTDLSFVSSVGDDAFAVSHKMEQKDGDTHKKVQHKIRKILRAYDTRCSYCRANNASTICKCKLERYCSYECMKFRWEKHQAAHDKRLDGSEEFFF